MCFGEGQMAPEVGGGSKKSTLYEKNTTRNLNEQRQAQKVDRFLHKATKTRGECGLGVLGNESLVPKRSFTV